MSSRGSSRVAKQIFRPSVMICTVDYPARMAMVKGDGGKTKGQRSRPVESMPSWIWKTIP